MAECPICKGTGRELVPRIHPITKLKKLEVEWCLCKKSIYISTKYPLLGMLGEAYMPLDDIDEQLVFRSDNLQESPNLLIRNTDYTSFCLHVKSILMKYSFVDPPLLIHFCKAFSILRDYYVEQNDGTCPQLADLNRFHLLIFMLDTKQKNDKLNTCVHEVVYSRMCSKRPTWIYLPEGKSLDNTWETSDELKLILKPDSSDEKDVYKKIELKKMISNSEPVINKVQRNAEDFNP